MRYDVAVTLKLNYSLAVEADSPTEATTKAVMLLGNQEPSRSEMCLEVEVGVI